MPDIEYKLIAEIDGERVWERTAPTIDILEDHFREAEKKVDEVLDEMFTEAYYD